MLNDLDAPNRSCGFRISLIGPSVFGHGYGSAATRLILAHAFRTVGLRRVELEVSDHNPGACHVYEQVGCVVEGTRRQAQWWRGQAHDAIIMALLAREWQAPG